MLPAYEGCNVALGQEAVLAALRVCALHRGSAPALSAPLALAVCIAQATNAFPCHQHWRALPVEGRIASPLLFAADSRTSALAWLHALQLLGVNALPIADYCLLARRLALLP